MGQTCGGGGGGRASDARHKRKGEGSEGGVTADTRERGGQTKGGGKWKRVSDIYMQLSSGVSVDTTNLVRMLDVHTEPQLLGGGQQTTL